MLKLKGRPLEEIILLSNTQEITGEKYPKYRKEYGNREQVKQWMSSLKKIVPNTLPLEADENAYVELKKRRDKGTNLLVVNFSEGFRGEDREAQMAAILELLGIPYACGTPLNRTITLNKVKTKEILMSHGIPSPRFLVVYSADEKINSKLNYPLFLKPIHEGSSMGISEDSKVTSPSELNGVLPCLLREFEQPILIEEYVGGEEYSVGLLGQELLPVVKKECSGDVNFQSSDVKFGRVKYVSPVENLSPELESKLIQIAQNSFRLTHCSDLARIDIRCDEQGNPFVLEINSPPTPSGDSSFGAALRAKGYSLDDAFRIIVENALNRYNKSNND